MRFNFCGSCKLVTAAMIDENIKGTIIILMRFINIIPKGAIH